MHRYTAEIDWHRGDAVFTDNRYPRRHRIRFDGGAELLASSSPLVVRAPLSDPAGADPEELFVASLSSCHMLWFLSIAAGRGYRVDHYADAAEGAMDRNADGKLAMTVITLRPQVRFSGMPLPDAAAFAEMHHEAHAECFIANSVRTELRCEPVLLTGPDA